MGKSRHIFWEQRRETVGPLVSILKAAAGVSNGDSASTLWSGAASMRSGIEGTIGISAQIHISRRDFHTRKSFGNNQLKIASRRLRHTGHKPISRTDIYILTMSGTLHDLVSSVPTT